MASSPDPNTSTKRPPDLAEARDWLFKTYGLDFDEDDPAMLYFCLGVYGAEAALAHSRQAMHDVTLAVAESAKGVVHNAVKPLEIVFKSVEQLKPMAEKLERLNREATSNIDAMNRATERLEMAAKAAAAGKRLTDRKRGFFRRREE